MRNKLRRAIVDDVTSQNIDDELREGLLDLFESAMRSVSATLVHEATFATSDFATAQKRGCEGFKLVLTRVRYESRNEWFGVFQRGTERLEAVGHME